MLIRKLFKFEGAHIVRNCTSRFCMENIHGHSYVVEVFISSDKLDKGAMILDFALLDKVKLFVDSFDHSFSLWSGESEAFKETIYSLNKRVVEIPLPPSAESFALMFFYIIDRILNRMELKNGEGNVKLTSVRVHETTTGYAEAFREDLALADFSRSSILFSPGIQNEWNDCEWWGHLD